MTKAMCNQLVLSPCHLTYQPTGCTLLYCTSLHYTALHFTSLHFTALGFTSLYFTSFLFPRMSCCSLAPRTMQGSIAGRAWLARIGQDWPGPARTSGHLQSSNRTEALAAPLHWIFRYGASMLHAPCSMLHSTCSMLHATCSMLHAHIFIRSNQNLVIFFVFKCRKILNWDFMMAEPDISKNPKKN